MTDQRRPAPVELPVALTIAGSDSGGGAGIQADLKTMEAVGAFGTSVVTAVTAQNTRGVASSHVLPIDEIEAQLDAVREDFALAAAKTGMLATAEVVDLVTAFARGFDGPLVVDPVMVAASGDRLLTPEAETAYEDLVAEATLVTPNADEAAVLAGVHPEDAATQREAGEALVDVGAEGALVKGGHVPGDEVRDVLVTPDGSETFAHPRIDTGATHGSGCTLSSAVAARLAQGDALSAAVDYGTDLLSRAVRYHHAVGGGPGAVHHLVGVRERAAREATAEAVSRTVRALVGANVRPLVPEVGMNVVGATPYAERVGETAAVEGRITKTMEGVAPNRGVRFGASSHVARFLLATREHDPDLRFAVDCRFADDVEAALESLDWTVAAFDRSREPAPGEEGSTMGWGARRAMASVEGTPDAILDRGAHGKEPIVKLLAHGPEGLEARTLALLDALGERDQR
jgi:hydroxymethylpyrimidine/phosphomethylpyrimidine kinase